jgi:CRISPR-associated protein Cas2
MEILIAYDVSTETNAGKRRLRRVALACQAFGQRVQKSVFECTLTDVQLERLLQRLQKEINESEDSLRIYRLVEPRERYVRVYGRDPRIDLARGALVV